uniref:Uncharacterized protein n=1 Tax=Anguilla anguilla TaxID=7936 RepID=A0A0E9XZ31_ANGAN
MKLHLANTLINMMWNVAHKYAA